VRVGGDRAEAQPTHGERQTHLTLDLLRLIHRNAAELGEASQGHTIEALRSVAQVSRQSGASQIREAGQSASAQQDQPDLHRHIRVSERIEECAMPLHRLHRMSLDRFSWPVHHPQRLELRRVS
jgi:hypothetical protein